MALKYELKYDDIVGVEHHFELFDDNYIISFGMKFN